MRCDGFWETLNGGAGVARSPKRCFLFLCFCGGFPGWPGRPYVSRPGCTLKRSCPIHCGRFRELLSLEDTEQGSWPQTFSLAYSIYNAYISAMEFEWDEAKNAINRRKHHLSFEEAIYIFNGPVWTRSDLESDEREERDISIGMLPGSSVLVVVHTERGPRTRIISARKATRRERTEYFGYLQETFGRN